MLGAIVTLRVPKQPFDKQNLQVPMAGSAFVVAPNFLITAHHIISKNSFKYDSSIDYHRIYFVSSDGQPLEIQKEKCHFFPDCDLTIIQVEKKFSPSKLVQQPPHVGEICAGIGYYSGQNKQYCDVMDDAEGRAALDFFNANESVVFKHGIITARYEKNMTPLEGDLFLMKGSPILRVSFGGYVGMSGGPVYRLMDNKIMGMMSMGYPPVDRDEKKYLFVLPAETIKKNLKAIRSSN